MLIIVFQNGRMIKFTVPSGVNISQFVPALNNAMQALGMHDYFITDHLADVMIEG